MEAARPSDSLAGCPPSATIPRSVLRFARGDARGEGVLSGIVRGAYSSAALFARWLMWFSAQVRIAGGVGEVVRQSSSSLWKVMA